MLMSHLLQIAPLLTPYNTATIVHGAVGQQTALETPVTASSPLGTGGTGQQTTAETSVTVNPPLSTGGS